MKIVKVLIADDHPLIIEGICRMLNSPDFKIVGTVSDGRALIQAAEKLKPDVIIADVTMPLLNGIEAAKQIRKLDPDVRIVFLTMHPDVTYATESLASGASAYVLKSAAGDELLTAIRAALKGRVYVSKSIADVVSRSLANGLDRKHVQKLTPRRREVLQLLAEGRSVKEIANILSVSPRTIEFHKYGLMDELGLKSTAELARYAMKHGIIA